MQQQLSFFFFISAITIVDVWLIACNNKLCLSELFMFCWCSFYICKSDCSRNGDFSFIVLWTIENYSRYVCAFKKIKKIKLLENIYKISKMRRSGKNFLVIIVTLIYNIK